MTKLEIQNTVDSIPLFGYVVICNRRWIPRHVNSDGKARTETVLAKRMSREPWTVNEDLSRNTWWKGVNDKEGRSWSDSTVESWQAIFDRSRGNNDNNTISDDDVITVCNNCHRASCWQGVFMCDEAQTVGSEKKTRGELRALELEYPVYWKSDGF